MDFYKGISLHVIPVHIIVPWFPFPTLIQTLNFFLKKILIGKFIKFLFYNFKQKLEKNVSEFFLFLPAHNGQPPISYIYLLESNEYVSYKQTA